MKALDTSVETLGLWIVTSSVTSIKSANQNSIKPCLSSLMLSMYLLDVYVYVYKIISYLNFLLLRSIKIITNLLTEFESYLKDILGEIIT